jgi:hypothetical protein
VELAISAIAITHSFMIISQARKGQRLRIQRSGHCIGCSPKARLRASPQALEAVYEQERQSFPTHPRRDVQYRRILGAVPQTDEFQPRS